MRVTLTAIKADIGSIGGHIRPSVSLLKEVERSLQPHLGSDFIDFRLSYTGDDIAILMTHTHGTDNPLIHQIAWDAFKAAAESETFQKFMNESGSMILTWDQKQSTEFLTKQDAQFKDLLQQVGLYKEAK